MRDTQKAAGFSEQFFPPGSTMALALEAAVLPVFRDAERYRWLREKASWDQRRTILNAPNEEIDADVDLSRSEGK